MLSKALLLPYFVLKHLVQQHAFHSLFPGSEQQSTLDVKGLLAKLQKSGILSAISNNRKETTDNDLSHRSITPPIPSEHRGVTERLPKPPSDLKDFSMRALKM